MFLPSHFIKNKIFSHKIFICFLPNFIHVKPHQTGAKPIIKSDFVFAIINFCRNFLVLHNAIFGLKVQVTKTFLNNAARGTTVTKTFFVQQPLKAVDGFCYASRKVVRVLLTNTGTRELCQATCQHSAEWHKLWSTHALLWPMFLYRLLQLWCSTKRRCQRKEIIKLARLLRTSRDAEHMQLTLPEFSKPAAQKTRAHS